MKSSLHTPFFQVIVQNYNSVLTLAHLYQLSDAILVHENDIVHKICSQLLKIKQISFSDINRVIAHQLGGVLQPTLTPASCGAYSRHPIGKSRTLKFYTQSERLGSLISVFSFFPSTPGFSFP